MADATDNANVAIRPPIALALVFILGLAVDWLYPLRFVPAPVPRVWAGAALFTLGLALLIWAVRTFRAAGTQVPTNRPTTAVVASGPYRFTRNPIYTGMFLGLVGLAVGFDTLWIFAMLIPFYLVIRYGVVAREEAYLERKFGAVYLGYKSRVRRWL